MPFAKIVAKRCEMDRAWYTQTAFCPCFGPQCFSLRLVMRARAGVARVALARKFVLAGRPSPSVGAGYLKADCTSHPRAPRPLPLWSPIPCQPLPPAPFSPRALARSLGTLRQVRDAVGSLREVRRESDAWAWSGSSLPLWRVLSPAGPSPALSPGGHWRGRFITGRADCPSAARKWWWRRLPRRF